MILVLEIGLFVMGIVFMARGRIDLGRNIVGKPMVYFVGVLMMFCLIVPLLAGFLIGFTEAAQGNAINAQEAVAKYWWVELACIGACGGLALILTLATQRPKTEEERYPNSRRRRYEDDDRDYDRPRRGYDRGRYDDDRDDRDDRRYDDEDDRDRRRYDDRR